MGDQGSSEPGILKIYDPITEILPSPGTIIIFPSSRQHSVFYNGNSDRIMIGVNFYALGWQVTNLSKNFLKFLLKLINKGVEAPYNKVGMPDPKNISWNIVQFS